MSAAEKKPKKPAAPKRCSCSIDKPGSVFWTCCVCRNWNLHKRTACGNCGHEKGGEPIAARWVKPSGGAP